MYAFFLLISRLKFLVFHHRSFYTIARRAALMLTYTRAIARAHVARSNQFINSRVAKVQVADGNEFSS